MTSPLDLSQAPLGKTSSYIDQYDASLLFPIPRAGKRAEIGLVDPVSMPFFGADMWTAYEVSWLNARGKPQVALAHITVPCESPNIIESKSFKLYLNSFNGSIFADFDTVAAVMKQDLSAAAGSNVGLRLLKPESFDAQAIHELDGLSLDRLDIDCTRYTPTPDLLKLEAEEIPISEVLVSHLLKSNCLVTGQPDWGSVQISYSGRAINQEGLLQYLVSFRNHNEFHEQCVERIFMDIWTRCKPTKLAVYARYTRRGGLDINPYRTSTPAALPANIRTARQ
jgi:7-cyano-7-deazaguanine reductase